jgi:hypothetical protein
MAEFQHFIPIFNKISLLCGPPSKRGKEGEKEAQRHGDFKENCIIKIQLKLLLIWDTHAYEHEKLKCIK